ncbi:MAG: hypothetical protein HON90_10205, partial [Halobacteriovoraceae bacterium]|nr:hypothetical protein [Halobacteriovoraceae bacterium]
KKIDLTSELHTYDLIIDCSDNFKTKFSLHDLCFQNKKTLIQGSIHKFEGQIQLFNFSKDLAPEKPCLRCLWPKTPAKSCVQTCSEAGVLGVVPGVIGSLQAAEAIKFLLELPTLNTGETLIINLFNFSTQKIKWSIDKNCPLCQQKDVLLTNFSYGESVFEVSFQELEKNDCHFIDLTKVPDSQVLKQISKINDQAKIILYCYHGVTSLKKTHSLRSQGFSNCFSLKGGINENAQCLN